MFHRKFWTGMVISPFSMRNSPSRVMPVLSSVALSTPRMYQKNVTSKPRLVCLIMSAVLRSDPSMTRLMLTLAFGLVLLGPPVRLRSTPFSSQVTGAAGVLSPSMVVCRRIGLPMSLLSVNKSLKILSPGFFPCMNWPPPPPKMPVMSDRNRAFARGSRITV